MKLNKCMWNEVRNRVKDVNSELYGILDDLLSCDSVLYISEYEYGEEVISQGNLNIAKNNKDLDYLNIPISVILDKNFEQSYISSNNHRVTFNTFSPGSILVFFSLYKENF